MKDIDTVFEIIKDSLKTTASSVETNEISLLYIQNTDGTIRWIQPAQLSKPLFLKFYSTSSYKSILYAFIIRVIFLLRIQKHVFKTTTADISVLNLIAENKKLNNLWAIFTGTEGPNRKILLYQSKDQENTFTKISINKNSELLIANEIKMISELTQFDTKWISYPNVLEYDKNTIEVNDISEGGKRSSILSPNHLNALQELSNCHIQNNAIKTFSFWANMKCQLKNISSETDCRIPNGIITKLNYLVSSIDENQIITCNLAHGDFTPWNMLIKNNKLHIYDWELATTCLPKGHDAFHFIIQTGILIERKPWKQIKREIDEKCKSLQFENKKEYQEYILYLKLYLILNITYNLRLFSQQEKWHKQINWLLKTWNEAISDLISKEYPQRKLMLMDIFDFLLHKPYAALKFPQTEPQSLSELSDVDLCIDKKNTDQFISYVKSHPLVKHLRITRKSFMTILQISLGDGGTLSVDLIHKLKRKSLFLTETKTIIENAVLNYYQVKTPIAIDHGRYIGLFYKANNAPIPEKYQMLFESLKSSDKEFDQKLYEVEKDNNDIIKLLTSQNQNQGLQRVRNIIGYILDSVKSLFNQSGMVVTFSGVDGAGKSTIIKNTKLLLEKKLRKRVIVIRHRPSLLPILSAWQKGKRKAEYDAANTLPRQGSNTSIISSILRFAYYYVDYIFGQYIIFIKHKMRGHIVLYDRYYFDFINDSKRSNIELPAFLTRFGYKFLLKPNLNFFLYAEPELILSRKKELTSKTIQILTEKYKALFTDLNQKENYDRYITIENVNLDQTLLTVLGRIEKQNTAVA